MQPWLTRQDVLEVIPDIPDSFEVDIKLGGLVRLLAKGWLVKLIGQTRVLSLREALVNQTGENPVPLSDVQMEWMELIRPFLVLAAWSEYVLNGNVTYTKSGPVTPTISGTTAIDKEQRQDLYRSFNSQAKTFALQLAEKRARLAAMPCRRRPGISSGQSTVTIIRAKNDSYFR